MADEEGCEAVEPFDTGPSREALATLHDRIQFALNIGHGHIPLELAREVIAIHEAALWCRDAALALTRKQYSWAEIADVTGQPDATLQSRYATWHRREVRG